MHIFGSASTGLIINRDAANSYQCDISDIDIVVEGKFNHVMIYNALQENERFTQLQTIEARVPITTGIDRNTGFSFDISINQFDGIKGSNIINSHKRDFKELKYLLLILKIILS